MTFWPDGGHKTWFLGGGAGNCQQLAPQKLTDVPGFARLAKTMKPIYIASLAALLLFLAWHFNMLERILDWIPTGAQIMGW